MQPPVSQTPSLLIGAVVAIAPSLLGRLLPPSQITQTIFGCLSCLAIVAAGAVAVWHYTNAPRTTLSAGEGAKMGLSTGAVALVISTALTLVFWASWFDRETGRPGLIATAVQMLFAALYYALVLRRKGGWTLYAGDQPPAAA